MENKPFEWTDALVKEFVLKESNPIGQWDRSGLDIFIDLFKKSKEELELQWYVLPYETDLRASVKGWTPYKQRKGDMGAYHNCHYFPDEKTALEFIIEIKPCISLLEIKTYIGISNLSTNYRRLEELVRSKTGL